MAKKKTEAIVEVKESELTEDISAATETDGGIGEEVEVGEIELAEDGE